MTIDRNNAAVMNAFDNAVADDLRDDGQLVASVCSRSETSASPSR